MERTHSPSEVGAAMSNGHSFKHVERGEFGQDQRRGNDTGVQARHEFASHIEKTMTASDTKCFSTQNNHEIYYNNGTNTFVAYDPSRQDLGTCFRPTSGERYFEAEFQKDIQHGGSRDRNRIVSGHEALQQQKQQRQAREAQRDEASGKDSDNVAETSRREKALHRIQRLEERERHLPQIRGHNKGKER